MPSVSIILYLSKQLGVGRGCEYCKMPNSVSIDLVLVSLKCKARNKPFASHYHFAMFIESQVSHWA